MPTQTATKTKPLVAMPTDLTILKQIADGMKQMARERASDPDPKERVRPVTHFFTRGAYVALQLTADSNGVPQWKLWVGRDHVFPGDIEMQTFRDAFGCSGLYINDKPAQRKINDEITRYAYVIRWHARTETRDLPGLEKEN